MEAGLEELVWQRAQHRCEYCHLPAECCMSPHQIDHVIAKKHCGESISENLALSCFYCNSYKGPNIAGIDPEDGAVVRLFHPRKDAWEQHFAWRGSTLEGHTAIGRVTIQVLGINDPGLVAIRTWLMNAGAFWSSTD